MGEELEELRVVLQGAEELVTPGQYRVQLDKKMLDLLLELVEDAIDNPDRG